MNNEFLRSGSRVMTRPSGLDFDLEKGSVYTLKWDDWDEVAFLEIGSTIELPDNLTKTKGDMLFITKVLNNFKSTTKPTTGVMLTGLKGSGKTVMSKMIAFDSGLPIIIVDSTFPTRRLDKFFSKFTETEVCVIFDEIDKNERYWNTEDLLGFLDGIKSTSKKLVLFTCNSDSKINEFVLDRCSRIRYNKQFNALSKENIVAILERYINDNIEDIATFILDKFKVVSYDNVSSFAEECKNYPDEQYEELVKDLNITLK